MLLTWQSNYLKKNMTLRKHARNWSIPQSVLREHPLPDGIEIDVEIHLANFSKTEHVRLASGHEFRLSKETSEKLLEIWAADPSMPIRFEVDRDQNAPLLNVLQAVLQNNVLEMRARETLRRRPISAAGRSLDGACLRFGYAAMS